MMQDSHKFVDLLLNIEWEEGLSGDIIQSYNNLIESINLLTQLILIIK
jgi:hypothetical protein